MASKHTTRDQICCIPHDPSVKTSSKMHLKSGEYGLHAIASRDMSAGTIILQCLPLAHSLLVSPGMDAANEEESKRRRCARCFFRAGDCGSNNPGRMNGLKRCSKCKTAYYCSRSCQSEDWVEQHKLECQYYAKKRKQSASTMATSSEEDAVPLLLRTFAALKQLTSSANCQESDGGIISCGRKHFSSLAVSPEYCTLSTLQSNYCSTNSSMKPAKECMMSIVEEKSEKAAAAIWGYNEGATLDGSIQRTLNVFQKNNFGIVDSLHTSIGEGVYPSAALLNHSCHPNCILRYIMGTPHDVNKIKYHPPILQIIACRDIKEGEELTHSYVDLALTTLERKSRLLKTHGFECNCARCNNECIIKLPDNVNDWALWPLKQKMGAAQDCTLTDIEIDAAMTGLGVVDTRAEYENIVQQSNHFQDQATHCMLEGDSTGELYHLQRAIDLFKSSKNGLSPFNFNLYSVRCSYLSALLAAGDIHRAVE